MLHRLHALVEHRVIATDGEAGRVQDFLFDDKTWMIHYLVVDVKRWPLDTEMILPVTAIKQLDWENKSLYLELTKEQVRESPDADTKEPVSRQQEMAMMDYFGKLAYWVDRRTPMTSSMPTGMNTRCVPKGIRTYDASPIWKVMTCGVQTAKSGTWTTSSWTMPPGTWAIWRRRPGNGFSADQSWSLRAGSSRFRGQIVKFVCITPGKASKTDPGPRSGFIRREQTSSPQPNPLLCMLDGLQMGRWKSRRKRSSEVKR